MVRQAALALLVLVLVGSGCRESAPPGPPPASPRIVSFSPALTAMLFDLGLGDHVVGVTSQDTLPAGQSRPVVGDAFSVNTEAVLAVKPDLVLTQVNPAAFDAVVRIQPSLRVEYVRIETLDDIRLAMQRLGRLAGNEQVGKAAAGEFQYKLDQVRRKVAGLDRPAVAFITDFERLGSAGAGTFIDQLIDVAGGRNVAGRYTGWVTLTLESLIAEAPQVIVTQAPAAQHEQVQAFWARHSQLPAVQRKQFFAVSDPNWTIPTARMADLADALADMIHPPSQRATTQQAQTQQAHTQQDQTQQAQTAASATPAQGAPRE